MDEDLDTRTREELIAEVKKLRRGIREHRDSTGHDLCWHHPALWGLLPEKTDPLPAVPLKNTSDCKVRLPGDTPASVVTNFFRLLPAPSRRRGRA